MTRAGLILLSLGTALFIALLAWQGVGAVASTFLAAGWGLALVAAFHVVPLVIDAVAITVMFRRGQPGAELVQIGGIAPAPATGNKPVEEKEEVGSFGD